MRQSIASQTSSRSVASQLLRTPTGTCERRWRRRLAGIVCWVAGIGLGVAMHSVQAAGEVLVVAPEVSTDGVFQLSWEYDGMVLIEESRDESFADVRVVYRGKDRATTLTGRSDGDYYYRLRPVSRPSDAAASATIERRDIFRVTVEHHPLDRAMLVFFVGFMVFAATVALVVRGAEGADDAGGTGDGEGGRG